MALVYTNNSIAEKELVGTITFKIVDTSFKYLGINLTKDVEDFYKANYETLRKK